MKLLKISLTWVRISILCIIVISAVILIGRQPGVGKLLKRVMTPAWISSARIWTLELDKTYTLCGHSEVLKNDYPSLKSLQKAIVDRNLSDQNNPGCRLKKISGHSYVYAISIPDYCSNCSNNHYLGIFEEGIAVIRGTPEKPGPIEEKIAVKIDNLPQLELNDLKKGIPFKSGNEKLQLIEGLKSLGTN